MGWYAGGDTSTGSNNAFFGNTAGNVNTTGNYNTYLGWSAGGSVAGSGSSNILIGSMGATGDNNTIRIGTNGTNTAQQATTYIAGIAGVTISTLDEPNGGPLVCIDLATGQLGTLNCAQNGAPAIEQQRQIQAQAQQIADLQQRLSRLESLIAKQ
jgi:hypothetical protein